ncbi:hypothetical protein CDD81_4868 [Ophiocordyceps australis]|uniref:Uncharacterized protein n=1 Tax=Ophiocordyceps australis TaxID=1399860 RepID=A0A2C5YBB2_9HYPO|nr:hypothetical protein CDD81_4868 [Ophiocordyceps australis]
MAPSIYHAFGTFFHHGLVLLFYIVNLVAADPMAEPLPLPGSPGALSVIPPMLGTTDPFLFKIKSSLRDSCPNYLIRMRRTPAAVARGIPGNLMFQCDYMNYLNPLGLKSMSCWRIGPEYKDIAACAEFAIADAILNTLPDWFVHVIMYAGVPGKLRNRLAADLRIGPQGSRRYQLKWLEDGTASGRKVCWPQNPSFSAADFDDVYGFIGALLVDPVTIGYSMPRRFMDYPPGFLRKQRFRTVDWRDYDPRGMIDELQVNVFSGLREPSLVLLRSKIDLWWGMAGRAVLEALREPGYYECPHYLECMSMEHSRCTGPINPRSASEILRLLLTAASLRLPIVLSHFETRGVRPNGPWVALPVDDNNV